MPSSSSSTANKASSDTGNASRLSGGLARSGKMLNKGAAAVASPFKRHAADDKGDATRPVDDKGDTTRPAVDDGGKERIPPFPQQEKHALRDALESIPHTGKKVIKGTGAVVSAPLKMLGKNTKGLMIAPCDSNSDEAGKEEAARAKATEADDPSHRAPDAKKGAPAQIKEGQDDGSSAEPAAAAAAAAHLDETPQVTATQDENSNEALPKEVHNDRQGGEGIKKDRVLTVTKEMGMAITAPLKQMGEAAGAIVPLKQTSEAKKKEKKGGGAVKDEDAAETATAGDATSSPTNALGGQQVEQAAAAPALPAKDNTDAASYADNDVTAAGKGKNKLTKAANKMGKAVTDPLKRLSQDKKSKADDSAARSFEATKKGEIIMSQDDGAAPAGDDAAGVAGQQATAASPAAQQAEQAATAASSAKDTDAASRESNTTTVTGKGKNKLTKAADKMGKAVTDPLKRLSKEMGLDAVAPSDVLLRHRHSDITGDGNTGAQQQQRTLEGRSPPPLMTKTLSDPDLSKPPGASTASTRVSVSDLDYTEEKLQSLHDEPILATFLSIYWPKKKGLMKSMPEDGRFYFTAPSLFFVGIFGTRFVWNWSEISAVEKASSMHSMVPNAVRLSTQQKLVDDDGGEQEGNDTATTKTFFFTFFLPLRDKAFHRMSEFTEKARTEDLEDDDAGGKLFSKVPPDETLQKMNVIVKKRLRGISVQDFYDVCWSEGAGKAAAGKGVGPLYGPWLVSCGKKDVVVGDWDVVAASDDGGGEDYVGEWCGERYKQKRIVTFNFMKKTIGESLVEVTHTQHCRVEGNDKCVLVMKVDMKGFPYADCFSVQVRWVASRVGANDLSVSVGLFVNFSKKTMFESKIRSGTSEETAKTQMDLFEKMKEACAPFVHEGVNGEQEEEAEDDAAIAARGLEDDAGEKITLCGLPLTGFFSNLFGRKDHFVGSASDDIECGIQDVSNIMDKVTRAAKTSKATPAREAEVRSEIEAVKRSLEKILALLDGS